MDIPDLVVTGAGGAFVALSGFILILYKQVTNRVAALESVTKGQASEIKRLNDYIRDQLHALVLSSDDAQRRISTSTRTLADAVLRCTEEVGELAKANGKTGPPLPEVQAVKDIRDHTTRTYRRQPSSVFAGACIAVLLCLTSGCGSRTERQEQVQTNTDEQIEGRAVANTPYGEFPLKFSIKRSALAQTEAKSQSATEVQTDIANALGTMLDKSLSVIAAKIGVSTSQPAPDNTTGYLAGGLGGLALLAGREWVAARQRKQREDEDRAKYEERIARLKADRDEAWDKLVTKEK